MIVARGKQRIVAVWLSRSSDGSSGGFRVCAIARVCRDRWSGLGVGGGLMRYNKLHVYGKVFAFSFVGLLLFETLQAFGQQNLVDQLLGLWAQIEPAGQPVQFNRGPGGTVTGTLSFLPGLATIAPANGRFGSTIVVSGANYECYYLYLPMTNGQEFQWVYRNGDEKCPKTAYFKLVRTTEVASPREPPPLRPVIVAPPTPSPGPIPPGHAYDPVTTVRAFYLALSRADGDEASALVVPEKRGHGPFNAENINQFYSSLRTPLRIMSIKRTSNDFVNVKYEFVRPNGTGCRGDARVNTIYLDGHTLIQGISANC